MKKLTLTLGLALTFALNCSENIDVEKIKLGRITTIICCRTPEENAKKITQLVKTTGTGILADEVKHICAASRPDNKEVATTFFKKLAQSQSEELFKEIIFLNPDLLRLISQKIENGTSVIMTHCKNKDFLYEACMKLIKIMLEDDFKYTSQKDLDSIFSYIGDPEINGKKICDATIIEFFKLLVKNDSEKLYNLFKNVPNAKDLLFKYFPILKEL
ncbi:MAG: hypothetical protein UR26_C0002G0207 [candidate division TM6 bacterium GW2011_GWF2_32_72]|nr:MAG: hypothetical protein UR26_C0002G0207 [candidate division TM6 bacterium GW2011_GWF2_32_72]